MDPKEIIEQSRQQRQQRAVEQARVADARKGATFSAGQDNNTGQPLVRAIGGAAVPMRSLSSVQPEVGQQGRSDGRGFDVGTRASSSQRSRPVTTTANLKIFLSTTVGGLKKYWIGGDRSVPRMIAEIDLAVEKEVSVFGESTGLTQRDWVFGLKTIKEGALPQPYRLRTIYGGGLSYDSGWAQIYESQQYVGGGFWYGNLFIENYAFRPETFSVSSDAQNTTEVDLPRTAVTTNYSNPQPIISLPPPRFDLSLSALDYKNARGGLDFQFQVQLTQYEILRSWWFPGTYPPQPGESGNAGAFEAFRDFNKQYTILGGTFWQGTFTPNNGLETARSYNDTKIVDNAQYFPGPEYSNVENTTRRDFTTYLGPNSPVVSFRSTKQTYNRVGHFIPTGTNDTPVYYSGSEALAITRKYFGNGGYYSEFYSGSYVDAPSIVGIPYTVRLKPSQSDPEITLPPSAFLSAFLNNLSQIVGSSWLGTDQGLKIWSCTPTQNNTNWLADGFVPVKRYGIAGQEFAQELAITGNFRPISPGSLGVTQFADVKVIGTFYWPKS
jgi:hypothetical protein